jgi:predicted membrane protein (TIGR00267 family)
LITEKNVELFYGINGQVETSIMDINGNLKSCFKRFQQFLRLFSRDRTNPIFDEIARRALVNNAFDGALTILGILMGNIILNDVNPTAIISTGYGAVLAMGMSGSFGRYFSERAERIKALKQIESYMFTDLSGSVLEREQKNRTILISLVDGVAPAIAAIIPLIPFFLAQFSIISVDLSIMFSFILDFSVLFVLGAFLGKIANENMLIHGFLVVGVGFATSLIVFLTSSIFSIS